MSKKRFRISGQVISRQSRRVVAGLRVEAWDKDLIFDDLVGSAVTDEQGFFIIEFTESYFREFLLDRKPDLFFKVFNQENKMIASTEDSVMWNVAAGDIPVTITVDAPDIPIPEAPLTAIKKQFKVKGRVQQQDGSPLAGATVQAFDKDLHHEQPLGEPAVTDEEGSYEISYTSDQFCRPEKKNADLIIRVFNQEKSLLVTSPLISQAKAVEIVNLAVGGGEFRAPSEYEQLLTKLTPFLDGAQPADLNQEDITFLVEKTGLAPQRISFLALSARLAKETSLPAEAYYGLFRQQLPTSLSLLLRFAPETWHSALKTALNENIIPACLETDLESILDRLQQMAKSEEPEGPGTDVPPFWLIPRLNYALLGRSVLDNLTSDLENKTFINENLNDYLRGKLAEVLSDYDCPALAAFIQTMASVDLAEYAETSLHDFMETQIADTLPESSSIRSILQKSVQKLSTTTTIAHILSLDQPIQMHPLFQTESNQVKFRTMLDMSPLLAGNKLQDTFIARYAEHEGPIEDFWKNLRQDPAFQLPNLVDDIQFTIQLDKLTNHYAPLIQVLRQQHKDITTSRQLTNLDLDDWKSLIRSTVAGETASIPEDIPGASPEEKIDNYAKSIAAVIEQSFPTVFVVKGIAKTPEIDLGSVRQVFAKYPGLNIKDPLPDDFDLTDLPSPEQAMESLEALRREINMFPDFDYHSLMFSSEAIDSSAAEAISLQNPIRNHLTRFFANASDFDFETDRVATYLSEHEQTSFQGIDEQARPAVIAQLKRMERVFQVTSRSNQMEVLQGEGLDSAYSIVSVPKENFLQLMGDRLGGKDIGETIYRNAMNISFGTQRVFMGSYQALYDIYPSVLRLSPLMESIKIKETIKISPTLESLFGSLELCDCKHCRSVYSPSAYFVDLLEFLNPKPLFIEILTGIKIKRPLDVLLRRRPDLTKIKLTCENAMTPMPYVDLVNEILEYYVFKGALSKEAARNTENITEEELKINPQHTIDDAYDILKNSVSSRYLPFNRDIEVARVWLEHLGSSRYQLMQLFHAEQTLEISRAADAEFINISPEEYQLLTGKLFDGQEAPPLLPQISIGFSGTVVVMTLQRALNAAGAMPPLNVDGQFGVKTQAAVKAFQQQHGLAVDGIVGPQTWKALRTLHPNLFQPFSAPVAQVSEVLHSLSITYMELVELLKTRFINPDPDSPKAIVIYTPPDAQCDLSVTRLQHRDGSTLDKTTWLKINKFIRLWRKLDWSMLDLDKAMIALEATDINQIFLQQLAQIKRLQADLKIPLVKLFCLWSPIDTHLFDSLYDTLFQNKAILNPVVANFELNYNRSDLKKASQSIELTKHLHVISAAAMIRFTDLQTTIRKRLKFEDNVNADQLNLANISYLYRHALLAEALELSVNDLIDLITFTKIDPFKNPEKTVKFVELVKKVKKSNFSVAQFNYLYRHLSPPPISLVPHQESLLLLARTLHEGLTQISIENTFIDDPTGEVTQVALAKLFEPEIAEQVIRMILDTAAVYRVVLENLLDGITFPDNLANKIVYDASTKTLGFTGLMGQADRDSLLAASAVALEKLPDGITFPDNLANKIAYDDSTKRLEFTGLMSQDDRDSLLAASADPDYQCAVNKLYNYQIAVNELYSQSEDFLQHSYNFIDNNLSGFLDTLDARIHLLDDSSVNASDGKPDPDAIAAKFAYILKHLLPYLRDRLSRSFIKQTLGEALQIDSSIVELLLETVLKSSTKTGEAAISDVLALQTSGLSAAYFTTDDLTATPNIQRIDSTIAFDGQGTTLDPTIPQGIHSIQWKGMIAVSKNEEYTFYLRANGSVKLWLGEESEPIIDAVPSGSSAEEFTSSPVTLKAGQLSSIRLEVTQISPNNQGIVELYWKSATTPKELVPADNLYPNCIFNTFKATFILLHKISLLVTGFKLTANEIAYLSAHKDDFDGFDLQQLPLERSDQELTDQEAAKLFQQWHRLYDYITLRDSLIPGETGLIDLFQMATAKSMKDSLSDEIIKQLAIISDQDSAKFQNSLATLSDLQLLNLMLALISGWDVTELTYLTDPNGLNFSIDHFRNEIALIKVQACMKMIKRLGVLSSILFKWADPEPNTGQAQEIKDTVKAKYDDETWPTIAKPLNDELRERQKAALIDYILAKPEIKQRQIRNADQLFEYFLIDVNMGTCMMTSRLKQAIASVQLFVQRCLMNLEPDVSPGSIDDEQWEWMKRYRVWEANRKVFLYPENWILPELRDDKSPFFKELESELLQNDLTPENVEKAYLHYLQKVDEVTNLDICGMYWEGEEDGRDQGDEILHVFGRTTNMPHIYYYRKWHSYSESWTPWEKVNCSIDEAPQGEGIHLIPVVFNRRLYLFWPIFTKEPHEEQPPYKEGETPDTHWEIKLAWSEYWQNRWTNKQISKTNIISSPFSEIPEPYKDKEQPGEPHRVPGSSSSDVTEEGTVETWKVKTTTTTQTLYIMYLPELNEHFFSVTKVNGHLLIETYRAYEKNVPASIINHKVDHINTYRQVTPPGYTETIFDDQDHPHIISYTPLPLKPELIGPEETEELKPESEPTDPQFVSIFEPLGTFDISGCNDSIVTYEFIGSNNISFEWINNLIQRNVLDSINDFMSYVSKSTAKNFSLNLSFIFGHVVPIFNKLDDDLYRKVLYPHQRPIRFIQNSSFYPFFYQDHHQSYFVRPIMIKQEWQLNKLDSSSLPMIDYELLNPKLKKMFGVGEIIGSGIRIEEVIFDNQELLRDTTPSILTNTRLVSYPESHEIAPSLNTHPDSSETLIQPKSATMLYSLDSQNVNIVTEEKLKFEIHYHPYVCKLIEGLNRDGLPGLLNLENQRMTDDQVTFKDYDPQDIVHDRPYPTENIDFSPNGAYSIYNWELFFHIPLMIATRLTQDQRFAEAQQWFHHIFNPTDSSSLDSSDKPWTRYWKVVPFRLTERERLEDMLKALSYQGDDPKKKEHKEEIEKEVEEWRGDPFKPHLIARKRPIAYQKTVVMKYIDNLIQWGDQLFRQDTIESINEATQLYILAYSILGKRPEQIPEHGKIAPKTYEELKPKLDSLSNALVPLENEFPCVTGIMKLISKNFLFRPQLTINGITAAESMRGTDTESSLLTNLSFIQKYVWGYSSRLRYRNLTQFLKFIVTEKEGSGQALYFCVPRNDTLLEYWDTVEDRLFKIRHCMNIEGVERQLPLYEPPIDPALLVQAAAKGIDLSSVLNEMNAPLPPYRFSYMLQKAQELCAEVKSLGAALLAALEKKDAEELAATRAQHEKGILEVMRDIKVLQIDEAKANKTALEKTKDSIQVRYDFYQARVKEKEENKRLPEETGQLDELAEAQGLQEEGQKKEKIASDIVKWTPDISTGYVSPSSVTFSASLGRANLIAWLEAASREKLAEASKHTYLANLFSICGQWDRRAEEWQFQFDVAEKDLIQIDKQIDAADFRVQIATAELENHYKQIENATDIEEFLRDKYTNQELYTWMIGQISSIFHQSYEMAYDLAKRAEKAYRFELGLTNSNFIKFGHWDSLRKGLLSGERLSLELKRLEMAYLEKNKREYEITKHISIQQLNPLALIALKKLGRCEIELPEWLFDMDYPGHYMRRIKNISITIPCVTGPYTSINCTLTLLSNQTRIKSVPDNPYDKLPEGDDNRFVTNFAAMQSIAASNAQNDSGLFELNFRDERYLPFEGAGAISTWRIELPQDFRQFDYDTISDVVIHMRYTAREGGGKLKSGAIDALRDRIKKDAAKPLMHMFSAKHEFPGEWHQFLHPKDTAPEDHKLCLALTPQRFPFLFRGRTIQISQIDFFLQFKDIYNKDVYEKDGTPLGDYAEGEGTALQVSLSSPTVSAGIGKLESNVRYLNGMPHVTYTMTQTHDVKDADIWTFEVNNEEKNIENIAKALRLELKVNENEFLYRLNPDVIDDLIIVCHYKVTSDLESV